MAKSSFTVFIGSHVSDTIAIYGVTSIMANLNGFLFNTEDMQSVQLDSDSEGGLAQISFEYNYTDEELDDIKTRPQYKVYDHRLKK